MSTSIQLTRPLAGLKQALRQCRAERQCHRRYATAAVSVYGQPKKRPRRLVPKSAYEVPTPRFRPSQAIKQNRFEEGLRPIRNIPPPRSTLKVCKDPIAVVTQDQLRVLDPTGERFRLFALSNPERVKPGDILLVRLKNGDDFAGVCLNIRQRHSPIDWAILLRNHLTRVAVEMWFKIYSPNVEGIELVQRKVKRARRAKLYYMRLPKHDMGSVEGIVQQYRKQRLGTALSSSTKGRDAKKGKKKKSNQRAKK